MLVSLKDIVKCEFSINKFKKSINNNNHSALFHFGNASFLSFAITNAKITLT